jgi:hypothetical protein
MTDRKTVLLPFPLWFVGVAVVAIAGVAVVVNVMKLRKP